MRIKWQGIVIHCTESDDGPSLDWPAIRRYHMAPPPEGKGWLDIGYNFGEESVNGETVLVVGRSMNIPGAHCRGYNDKYLGFAFVCKRQEVPSDEELRRSASFMAGLLDSLGVNRTAVYAHKELNDTTCPDSVPMDKLRELIRTAK